MIGRETRVLGQAALQRSPSHDPRRAHQLALLVRRTTSVMAISGTGVSPRNPRQPVLPAQCRILDVVSHTDPPPSATSRYVEATE